MPCGAIRPNCLTNEIQPCSAFHTKTGANTNSATRPPPQNQGLRSQCRARLSIKSQQTTPGPKKRSVYFEVQARPVRKPNTSQNQGRSSRQITERLHSASAQNIVDG